MQSPQSLASQTLARQDRDEQEHFENVCEAYRQYATFAMLHWTNQQHRLEALPESQKRLLPAGLRSDSEENKKRATDFRDAAIRNQFCLDCILRHAEQPHSQESQASIVSRGAVSDGQISKVSSVLKSLTRDWSEDGKAERDMAYGPILQSVAKYVPVTDTEKPPRISVPGAGEYTAVQ
jgi:carnosine N-methyltransferase